MNVYPRQLRALPSNSSSWGKINFPGGQKVAMGASKPGALFNKNKKKHKSFIAGAIKHPGALHRQLGIKQGEKIPAKKLAAAAKKGGKLGRRARLAETLKGLHHKKHKRMSKEIVAREGFGSQVGKRYKKNDHDADDMKKKGMRCKRKHKHTSACK